MVCSYAKSKLNISTELKYHEYETIKQRNREQACSS